MALDRNVNVLARTTRVMGDYALAIPEEPQAAPPDWIGYRASLARISRRQAVGGEIAVTCAGCGTELDVTAVVHSPRCTDPSRGTVKPEAGWDQESTIAAIHLWVEENGEIPRADQWLRGSATHPGYGRVVALFGNWREMVLAAGLEPRKKGGKRPTVPGRRSSPAMKAAADAADAERRASYAENGLIDPEELYG